ncbi:MAG TPA: glycoside hydrolase family 44 protein [Candidatus Acidoferrum sp.]|nr:glycoside hydrolase family 44 protein [Candidatus Acidoferrum sp.]
MSFGARPTRVSLILPLTAALLSLMGCGGYGGGGNGGGGGGGGNAPSAPTGLTANPGNAQVTLNWTASSGATGYYVKRSTTTGAEAQIAAVPTTAYTDTPLTNGTTYYYVVSAYNSYGPSPNSAEVNAMPVLSVPAAPTGLITTAGNAQVALAWTASVGATSYNVKRSTTTGGPYNTLVASPMQTAFTDTTVTNGTKYFYVVTAVNVAGQSGNSNEAAATPAAAVADVTITINPAQNAPISPYIYGTNFYSGNTTPQPNFTFDRDGGNRWTAYNWENNFSNAGSDYIYNNDLYLCNTGCNPSLPGEAVRTFIAGDQIAGLASLVTFQLQGLVSADGNGPVSTANPPDMTRFKTLVDKKGSAFTTAPSTSDANVYMDEFAWFLDQKLPGIFAANPSHPTFISLDNEPDLWNSTHLEVQGSTNVSSTNFITKSVTLSEALKDQFPNLVIFGPVNYGFGGVYSWQGDPTLSPTPGGANWFADKYLAGIKTASMAYGKPVVDVYDFHWYSEACAGTCMQDGSTRVTNLTGSTLTDTQVQAIVQSPRSLWDPSYTETSWIANVLGGPINILGRLQAKITANNPGMKLAITEYESGGFNHIAGTIAQADNLGIFGSVGLFAANFWPPNGTYSYTLAGFRAYRNFDGAGSNFGDTSLQATSSSVKDVVVYASKDSTTPGRIIFVAINRASTNKVTAINGQALSGTAHIYQMTGTTAAGQTVVQPVSLGTMPASGSSLTITLPAYSVTTIDIQ